MHLMHEAARTSIPLLLVLPIVLVPTFFTTTITAKQSDALFAQAKLFSRQSSTWVYHYAKGHPTAQQRKPPSKADCLECDESALMLHEHSTIVVHALHYRSRALAKRSLSPSFPKINDLIWNQMGLINNVSAMTSYIYAQFYKEMTVVWAKREKWVGPAVHVLIFTCGAIKLRFEIMATERHLSMQIMRDLVQDFARTMLHVTKSVVLASYRLIALTAFAILFVTLQIVQNASPKNLITPPLI